MKIILTPRADRDLAEAVDYLVTESPSAAHMLADTIDGFTDMLKANPKIGKSVGRSGWRVFALTAFRYNIFYRIAGDTIIIETIFHTAQNPKKAQL